MVLSILIRFRSEKNHIVVEVPTALYGQYLKEKYGLLIEELVEAEAQCRMEVTYELADTRDLTLDSPLFESLLPKKPEKRTDSHKPFSPEKKAGFDPTPDVFSNNGNSYEESGLLNRFTFDAFVVGPSNQFAHAAARAVAHNPAKSYNPLYLHGGVGLGKTHLMHAIGNEIYEKDPSQKILYVESERDSQTRSFITFALTR